MLRQCLFTIRANSYDLYDSSISISICVSTAEELLHREKIDLQQRIRDLQEELQLTETHLAQSQERKAEVCE